MGTTPQTEKMYVAVFGRRNAGKSSLIRALTGRRIPAEGSGQEEKGAEVRGPFYQTCEFAKMMPVTFIDTPGFDEPSVSHSRQLKEVMEMTDVALVIFSDEAGHFSLEKECCRELEGRDIPVIGVITMVDDHYLDIGLLKMELDIPFVKISAKRNINLGSLRHAIRSAAPSHFLRDSLVGGCLQAGELAVMVMPGSIHAPKHRLCTQQQHILRDLLDHHVIAMTVLEPELPALLRQLKCQPDLVIADTGSLERIHKLLPAHVRLTTYSALESGVPV